MLVEGLIYCLQSRLKLRMPEGSISAGGCSFNSFLRRTVRFVGTTPTVQPQTVPSVQPTSLHHLYVPLQVCMCSDCVPRHWSLTSSSFLRVIMHRSSSLSVSPTTHWLVSPVTETLISPETYALDMTTTPSWPPGEWAAEGQSVMSLLLMYWNNSNNY